MLTLINEHDCTFKVNCFLSSGLTYFLPCTQYEDIGLSKLHSTMFNWCW